MSDEEAGRLPQKEGVLDELLNDPAATVGVSCLTSDWPKLHPPLPMEESVRHPNSLDLFIPETSKLNHQTGPQKTARLM